jgi:ankyrin repeat protein
MKKTIIYLGLALVSIANVTFASTAENFSNQKELVYNTNTPLCNAIAKGDIETVKKFIEYGADVNQTQNGMTPLMTAARYNRVDILKYLLEKGAEIDAKDERGNNALKYATLSNAKEAEAFLKQV